MSGAARRLADKADSAPRKVRFGDGRGGTVEDEKSIFELVREKESNRLQKRYKEDIEARERMMDKLARR